MNIQLLSKATVIRSVRVILNAWQFSLYDFIFSFIWCHWIFSDRTWFAKCVFITAENWFDKCCATQDRPYLQLWRGTLSPYFSFREIVVSHFWGTSLKTPRRIAFTKFKNRHSLNLNLFIELNPYFFLLSPV